jgi:hypothetical protein
MAMGGVGPEVEQDTDVASNLRLTHPTLAFVILRQPKPGQVIVDFGKPIGEYWNNGTKVGETQFGAVSFGKNGAHIIPVSPRQW